MATTYWNGSTSDDFFDPTNWSNEDLPQSHTCQAATIAGTSEDDRAVAVANAVSYGQIHSLSIGDYGTLKITAQASSTDAGNVFSTYGMEIAPTGELIVDTSSQVELGLYTQNRGGTITIIDNPGKVVLDGNSLNGTGTLNLVNSTLGSAEAPIHIPDMDITLQNGSTLYTGWNTTGSSITFDPSSTNTVVLDANDSTISTAIYGVSENSQFAINGSEGVTPASANVVANGDGSYSYTISFTNGHSLTLSDIVPADGFVPGSVSFSKDAAGDWLFTEQNASTVTPDYASTTQHEQLQAVVTHADDVGSGTAATTNGYTNHSSVATDTFIGTGTESNPASWSDTSNWSQGDIPQSDSCFHASLSGSDTDPLYVVADQSNVGQFVSLSVNPNATLTITANNPQNPNSYVFSTAGFEVRGNGVLNIDTPAKVELGGVSAMDGTLNITGNDGNVVFDSSHLAGGGTLNLSNSTLGTQANSMMVDLPQINLTDDSTFYARLYGNTSTISFDDSSNTLVLAGDTKQIDTTFVGVNANTHFAIDADLNTQPTAAVYTKNDDGSYSLAITLDNGQTYTLSHIETADGFVPGSSTFSKDAAGDWLINTVATDVCFVEGTLIRTTRGDVAVEDLSVGDELIVVDADASSRPVVWVGFQNAVIRPELDDADAGYPVRILKDAISENVPSADLLVTAEHGLYLEGGFVPVRMLVNGSSIFYDRSVTSYRYFHVETERHSIILAENVATESYLDTGNRRSFTGGAVVSLTSRHLTWADAAAPLLTDRETVEDLHQRIAARAVNALGLAAPARPPLTRKSDLSFRTLSGQTLRRLDEKNGVVTVEVPENVTEIRICSRADRPSDIVGPFVDDRRMLGVLVGSVTLLEGGSYGRAVNSHLDGQSHVGWHGVEKNASVRWTNGDAVLDLGERVLNTKALLKIQIAAAGPYRLETNGKTLRLCA